MAARLTKNSVAEVAISAFTRVFDALLARPSKDAGQGAVACILRGSALRAEHLKGEETSQR
jgi:hypothetical protein